MLRKMIVRSVVGCVFLGLILFVPAGTLAWPQAWIFMALFMGCSMAIGVWLWRADPGLLAERMKSPFSDEQKRRDRLIMGAMAIGFWGWLVLAGLDAKRFGWSHVPLWLQALGAVLILIAFYGWVTVMRANSFAAVTIQLQPERKQTVITSGPYAVVRHPMYSYALLLMAGTALLLGSLWSLAGVVPLTLLLMARARGEEAMLLEGLQGYREYTGKVRFRLVPGIW
jgi:protein-S-isoprenylcysteine O-methyltransferase Ste14